MKSSHIPRYRKDGAVRYGWALSLPPAGYRPMKKSLLLPLFAAVLALAACGKPNADSQKLVVAATAVPHAEILAVVKPLLQKEGLELEVRVFNDYV